jgi:ion channel POLLUX/CASTOR
MQISWKQKIRYRFDNAMSGGAPVIIVWLGIMALVLIVMSALAATVFGIAPEGSGPLSLSEALWSSLMHSMDAGAVAGNVGWSFRALMFVVTLGGIFVVSTLIGALSNGIESVLERLRKGRSLVCEQDHTVILGYNSKLSTLIHELVTANLNRKNACIVVLAPRDKVELEDELRASVDNLRNTRLVVRSGNPCVPGDLAIANANQARAIIVLSPEDTPENDADALTIKTILGLTNNPERRPEPYHIVAEIRHPRNLDVARIVGKKEAELILTDDFVSRVMVQTSRQSGLSVVYQELLDFAGVEIYFTLQPTLVGRSFADAMQAFATSTPIGLLYADGHVQLNPPHATLLAQGDQIIAISADDDTLTLRNAAPPAIRTDLIRPVDSIPQEAETALMLGWNRKSPTLISELDHYMVKGSSLTVVAEQENLATQWAETFAGLNNLHVHVLQADPSHRKVLEQIDVSLFDHILVLAESDTLDREQADSRVLMTLLQLRHIQEQRGLDLDIVSEMMDSQNRDLAEATRADDFIVSDKLVGLLIGQVAENKALMQVFDDLFSASGSEIYLRPVEEYIRLGATVNFATLATAARQRGEIAIGYRSMTQSHNADAGYGVVLNPDASAEIDFYGDDCVIVLAEK